ncbi:MAG: helix-turn-helix transcriptional regulator [Treponema sp.]|nr:helix-turn-helix transcriptional regulator [Treponema sp.]
MFGNRLREIMKAAEIRGNNLANILGCSKSYISHLLRGDKQPAQSTDFTMRLAESLWGYANDKGSLSKLERTIGLKQGYSRDDYLSAITDYLHKDEGQKVTSQIEQKKIQIKSQNLLFGEKLGQVMEIGGLSNSKLARLVNIDSSSVSRYRKGKRSVQTNNNFILKMCRILYGYVQKHDKLAELEKLIGLDDGEKLSEKFFISWLYGDDTLLQEVEKPAVEELQFLSPEEVMDESLLADSSDIYIGNEGLRKAVLRFLITAAKSGGGEMKLYSDLKMDWMVGSKEYFQHWYSLMSICLRRGVKIIIIHNIDRRRSEMNNAVQGWMPLYMEGNIQSYYNTRQNGKRFYNTLFLYRYLHTGGVYA